MDLLEALNKKFIWDYYEDERNDVAFKDEIDEDCEEDEKENS